MNEKITLQDLINLFGEKQGLSKKDAELFVRTMFDLIEEALATEKYVKVKGFGTFKLTEVESRESVNVNTGERIEIQGHTKISFTPDTTMKDLINKPFAHFETVILNEGIELEDTPIETPDTLETSKKVDQVVETPVLKEIPVQEEVVLETIVEKEPEVIKEPEPEIIKEVPTIEEVPILEETPLEEPQPEMIETPKEEKKEKTTNRILWGIIVVLALIILLGAYWIFLRPSDTPEVALAPSVQEKAVTTPVKEIILQDTLKVSPTIVTYQQLSAEELRNEHVPSLADTLDYQIVGTKTLHTLQNGETIIRASVKFFGTKKFWPYIVKHNQNVLKDADNIPAGTEIKIPELTIKNQEDNKQK